MPTRALDDEGRAVQVWVPRDAPGLTVIDDWTSFGQRTTASGSVRFDAVRVDPDDVLPLWQLADCPGLFGPNSQLVQAAIDQGIAQAALADALAFVRERARPWVDSGPEHASDDPYIIQEGRLRGRPAAAGEVLLEAGRTLDAIASVAVTAESSARALRSRSPRPRSWTTQTALDATEKAVRARWPVRHARCAQPGPPLAQRTHSNT